VNDIIDELHGAKYFKKLNLQAKYYQIQLQPEDMHKMAL
jgi:hypothetical protein